MAYLDVEAGRLLRPALKAMSNGVTPDVPREAGLDPVGNLGRFFTRGVSALTAALQPEFAPAGAAADFAAKNDTAAEAAAAAAAAKFWQELQGICWCPVSGSVFSLHGWHQLFCNQQQLARCRRVRRVFCNCHVF